VIDASCPFASWFLWIASSLFLLAYALPLLFAPLAWARWFRWRLPETRALTVYLGRCTGALACTLLVFTFRAAPHPREHRLVLEEVVVAAILMTAVHAWGALKRQQPWTEDVEIVLYAAVAGAAWFALRSL